MSAVISVVRNFCWSSCSSPLRHFLMLSCFLSSSAVLRPYKRCMALPVHCSVGLNCVRKALTRCWPPPRPHPLARDDRSSAADVGYNFPYAGQIFAASCPTASFSVISCLASLLAFKIAPSSAVNQCTRINAGSSASQPCITFYRTTR